ICLSLVLTLVSTSAISAPSLHDALPISLPSIPRHLNVSCGILLYWLQLILVVINVSIPDFFKICGSAQLYPNISGNQRYSVSFPNSSRKKLDPNNNWRTNDSPDGILQSASSHIPPSASQRPSFIRSFICWYNSG